MNDEREKKLPKIERIVNKSGPYIWMLTTIDDIKKNKTNDNLTKIPRFVCIMIFIVCAFQWKWSERKKEH